MYAHDVNVSAFQTQLNGKSFDVWRLDNERQPTILPHSAYTYV